MIGAHELYRKKKKFRGGNFGDFGLGFLRNEGRKNWAAYGPRKRLETDLDHM